MEKDTTVAWCLKQWWTKLPVESWLSRVWLFISKGSRKWVAAFTTRTSLSSVVLFHWVWSRHSYPLHILESEKGARCQNLPSLCISTDHRAFWALASGTCHQVCSTNLASFRCTVLADQPTRTSIISKRNSLGCLLRGPKKGEFKSVP